MPVPVGFVGGVDKERFLADLDQRMNSEAEDGWHLSHITQGPQGVFSYLLVFEKPASSGADGE